MKGDFIGFSFDGVHSDELGIVRIADNDGYTDILHPEMEAITTHVNGMDGDYYFGTDHKNKKISISIAFDSVTEEQLRRMRGVFSGKKVGKLIFDEVPYKFYLAKVEEPIELTYICFDDEGYTWEKIKKEGSDEYYKGVTGKDYEYKKSTGKTQRIYKGNGKIELICYYPYAQSVFKYLPDETGIADEDKLYPNIDEWAPSSKILTEDDYTTNQIDIINNKVIKLYNPGDIKTPCLIYCPKPVGKDIMDIRIHYYIKGELSDSIIIEGARLLDDDTGLIIDIQAGLIEGAIWNSSENKFTLTSNLYNKYMKKGSFFEIEPCELEQDYLQFDGDEEIAFEDIKIFYNYLYY